MDKPRASIHALGCRLNQAEGAILGDVLAREGYAIVPFGEPTDLLVLNTCAVTEHAEKDCRYAVRKTLRHSPDAFVAVTGCYAQTGQAQVAALPGVDLVVGNQFKMDLATYLPSAGSLRKRSAAEVHHTRRIEREEFVLPGTAYSDSTRALLKIQDGCDVMCSFCLIPFARGRERSRQWADLIREAEALAARGYKELVLTGVNIGRYQHREGNLVTLIRRLEAIQDIARIRISSIEPTTVSRELLEYMATSDKLCPHLHVPVQSGDDRILRAMNRPYTVKEYTNLVETACRLIPGLGIGTDLMVGFPGEDDEEFDHTARLARELPFNYFHVFSFSPRPGTAAARLTPRIPSSIIRHRSRTLSELSRMKSLAYAKAHIGRSVSALFEHRVQNGLRMGLTDNFMRVGVTDQAGLAGNIHSVTITGVTADFAVARLASSQAHVPEKVALL